MKNVEEAIAENAKGILASTMKEEINQLVKESLSEQEDDEVDVDADINVDDTEDDVDTDVDTDMDVDDVDLDADNEDDMDMDMDMDSEETPIDLTDASDEEILKVFKAMGEEDGIIVKKDGTNVHLKDNDADVEYLVKLGESKEKSKTKKMKIKEDMDLNFDDSKDSQDASTEDVINAIFGNGKMEESDMDESDMEEEYGSKKHEFKRHDGHKMGDVDGHYKDYEMDEEDDMDDEDDMDEVVYEIEFDEDDSDFDHYRGAEKDDAAHIRDLELDMKHDKHKTHDMYEDDDEEEMNGSDDDMEESYNPQYVGEGKKLAVKKPKGVGLGHGPKFSYKSSGKGGFKDDKKEGPKTMGTGKAKFEYKKGENMEGNSKVVKKAETKEAARTFGNGSKEGRGLRKGITNNRNYVYSNSGVKVESLEVEVRMLREKNDEYRKALNVFREKLNEVAIFNSNLAYATRLFTEHSTTKKEKINILRRFDDVETLKESKSLYKSLKDELAKVETKSVNESVEKTINNTVSSGSATTLIESKTYENPQFLRMKDLMTKIK